MHWQYEMVQTGVEQFPNGMSAPIIGIFLTNEAGIRISPMQVRDGWEFTYTDKDLKILVESWRRSKPDDERNNALGPECAVGIMRHKISRPVTPLEGAAIAQTISIFLKGLHLTPVRISPPPVETIVFMPWTIEVLRLDNR